MSDILSDILHVFQVAGFSSTNSDRRMLTLQHKILMPFCLPTSGTRTPRYTSGTRTHRYTLYQYNIIYDIVSDIIPDIGYHSDKIYVHWFFINIYSTSG
jgi:hypothetical protein